jgi:hypothetical protein
LRVVARYADGTTRDVTRQANWTSYRVSNPNLASLGTDGLIVSRRPGTVFVTVVNEAATAVKELNQTAAEGELTAVEAVILDPEGRPAAGAQVRLVNPAFDPLMSDADGRVRFEQVPGQSGPIRLLAIFERDDGRWYQEVVRPAVSGGVTDFGQVQLRPVDELIRGSTFGVRETLAAAISTSGGAWGWGLVPSGGLAFRFVPEPVLATPAGSWKSVSSGRTHLLAIDRNGFGWAWGENQQGQRGWGSREFNQKFEQVDSAAAWKMVSAGNDFSLGIQADGSLWAWGSNGAGQLGLGPESAGLESTNVPTRIGSRFDWIFCSAGEDHCLAIQADGSLWAWGANSFGQCGVSGSFQLWAPTQVGSDHDWLKVSAGNGFSLGVRSDKSLWVWGNNNIGQLGTGADNNAPEPAPVETGTSWKAIAAGKDTAVAIKSDGTLWWSGRSPETQYAPFAFPPRPPSGSTSSSWVQLGDAGGWQSVSAGTYFVMVMRDDSSLWAFGALNFQLAAWLELGSPSGPLFGIEEISQVESESPWLAPVP